MNIRRRNNPKPSLRKKEKYHEWLRRATYLLDKRLLNEKEEKELENLEKIRKYEDLYY